VTLGLLHQSLPCTQGERGKRRGVRTKKLLQTKPQRQRKVIQEETGRRKKNLISREIKHKRTERKEKEDLRRANQCVSNWDKTMSFMWGPYDLYLHLS